MKLNEKERILFMFFVGYDICIFVMLWWRIGLYLSYVGYIKLVEGKWFIEICFLRMWIMCFVIWV